MQQININRNYKDRLFRLAFQEKEDLLDLYNAVSGRQYTNPEDIIITTLADAIYLGMKNDISFLVSDVLNLYEHQSSFNPNMPVRGLNYFADTYREYIEINGYLWRKADPPSDATVYRLLQWDEGGTGPGGTSAFGCIFVSESRG